MKKSLGRYFLSLILLCNIAYSKGFTTTFKVSNSNPYLKEPITLTLDINQTDSSSVMLFKFDINKSQDYEFHRINIKKDDDYHSVKIHYTYIIYPLKSGKIDINFNLLQMVTTDDKIAYSFSGDRDNVRGLNKTDIPITLKPLSIDVKSPPKDTDIIGDFKLEYKIKKDRVKPYQPIPIDIKITGSGYSPIVKNIIPQSKDYKLFEEITKGLDGSVDYSIAISAKSSFEIKDIEIKGFNPKSEKSYILAIPKHKFIVEEVDKLELVDNIDSPKPISYSWDWLISFFSYLSVFIAGFLTSNFIKRYKKSPKDSIFVDKISKIKDEKSLLTLLISINPNRYKDEIYRLEDSIYGSKKESLKDIKKSLIDKERDYE